MPFPVITAPVPTVVPSVAERVYDRFYIQDILVSARDPADPIVVIAHVKKARIDETGNWELSPDPVDEHPRAVRIDDLLTRAAGDAALAQVIGGLMQQVAILVAEQLTPPETP